MKLSYGRQARQSRRRDRLRDWSEGGNERLARVTFGGNSIVESCKVIERCGSWSSRACSPSLPQTFLHLSLFLSPCHSAPFPALLINKADSLSLRSSEGCRAARRSGEEAA